MRRAIKKTFFLFGSSARGTWREGCFTADHVGYVKKAQEKDKSLHKGPVGEPESGLVYRSL
jgi:hypothetical protein